MVINPIWFYWIDVVNSLDNLCCGASVLCGLAAFVFICGGILEIKIPLDDGDEIKGKKLIKVGFCLVACVVIFALASVFIPSKSTLIEMQVVKFATKENGELVIENIKEAVDYICTKLGELK